MSNAKHTPGPWEVSKASEMGFFSNDGGSAILQHGKDEKHIGFVTCHASFKRGDGCKAKCAERDANARLIAAAPELLEALEAMMPTNPIPEGRAGHEAYAKAAAAIAKARG